MTNVGVHNVRATAAVVTVGGFVVGLDTSLVNVGLQTISRDLGAPLDAAQWIATAYLLALAAALPACGWLSRRFGAGRVWRWALVAFTVASALCAVSPTLGTLVAARTLQGLAGGILIPAGMTVLAQLASPGAMGRVLAVTGVPTVLAPALGPTIGGLLLSAGSWPWLFLVNLPIGAVAALLAVRLVPVGVTRPGRSPLDLVGLALLAGGLALVTYASTLPSLPLLAVGLLAVIAFVRRAVGHPTGLLDLRPFASRTFAAAALTGAAGSAALFGAAIIVPLYFQLQRGQDVLATGLLLLPAGLAAAATFPIAGRLTDRHGGGIVATGGLALVLASTAPLVVLKADADLLAVAALQVTRGIGLALTGISLIVAALGPIPQARLADATTEVNVLQRAGAAIGSALLVVALTAALPASHRAAATAEAFHKTFAWLTATTALAMLGAAWVAIEQRRLPPTHQPEEQHS